MVKNRLFSIFAVLALLATTLASGAGKSLAADESRTFPETGKTVSGRFLTYWNNHGGLAQQGYPISEVMQEQSDIDGNTYTVQYFERAVFEYHPENDGTDSEVLLSLLGVTFYNDKYGGNASGQKASTTNPRKFSETGKTIGGVFRTYWEKNGGLAQQGYPISDEFNEKNDTDGKTYKVQYFQRAVFEYHPENAGKPGEVLLSLLGTFRLNGKGGGGTTPPAGPTPTPSPPASTFAAPGWTSIIVTTNNFVIFYNESNGHVEIAKLGADGSITTVSRYPDPATGSQAFTAGWSHIVALPNNRWLAYNKTTGVAYVAGISDEGALSQQGPYNFSTGWSYITFDLQTGLGFFYNETTEGLAVCSIPADSNTITTLKFTVPPNAKPTDFRWSQFVPIGNGLWFWYVQGNGNGLTVSINSDGTLNTLKSYTTFDRDWTHIVGAGVEAGGLKMVFYKKGKGVLNTAVVVASTGDYVTKQPYSGLSADWSIVTGTPNGIVIFYDATGRIATDQVNIAGVETALKRYTPVK